MLRVRFWHRSSLNRFNIIKFRFVFSNFEKVSLNSVRWQYVAFNKLFRFHGKFTYFIVTHLGYEKYNEWASKILSLHDKKIKGMIYYSNGELTITVKCPLGLQMA